MDFNLLPVLVFIITSIAIYMYSSDPDKKKKPLNFIIPGIMAGAATFLFFKYNPPQQKLMEGNYFD